MHNSKDILIIGGGLAGSEAAWQAARAGIKVRLYEMRPKLTTKAHQGEDLAELVCSNSFRSDDTYFNAVGLLHEEMRRADSLIMACAHNHKVPAGGALAVDREGFAKSVTKALENHDLIEIIRDEVKDIEFLARENPHSLILLATGPLTSDSLSASIGRVTGSEFLSFFDAIAPIVTMDSINMDIAWRQSRYDKEGPGGEAKAYINCPLNQTEYENFIQALLDGPKSEFKEWENVPYFDGCLPIEVMAERGKETLRYGPMKPVGLTNPRKPNEKSFAVVQLRQDNALGTLFNMVGFQTKLKHGAQAEIFRMIPGLENASFARLGGLHRNTFIRSPELLDCQLRLKTQRQLRFAGQMTGVEGYVESAALGLLAGRMMAAEAKGQRLDPPPATTALGALIGHVTDTTSGTLYQPMNITYGLLPSMEAPKRDNTGKKLPPPERGRAKKRLMSERALKDLEPWLSQYNKSILKDQMVSA
jgi:methylenetetrahydrofolate--tRNA-(uracil-5-)-methyltransferase